MSKVFITGGTGSLGEALLAYYNDIGDDDITVYSRDEVKQSNMRRKYPDVRYLLGDVRDYDRLLMAMRGAEVVIHAGAYKQVPSAEANVDEAIATNVIGSLHVARAAVHSNVGTVVGVSTDKACAPVNAYGETKALMEKLFQQADSWGDTIFNLVRYGNVLGSRGSVVPLFRKQLAEGYANVTDPDMTRFWMTLEEAVDIVMAAIDPQADVADGAILVPQVKASTMHDLLLAVAASMGKKPDEYEVAVIGTRAGEKKHEQLVHVNESLHTLLPVPNLPYYQILPATTIHRNHATFEYRSDTADQLTVEELTDRVALCVE